VLLRYGNEMGRAPAARFRLRRKDRRRDQLVYTFFVRSRLR
jgi:hypothetical protein